jgi:hypothetical protein
MVAGIPILANDLPELNRFVTQQGIGMNYSLTAPDLIAEAIDRFFELDLQELRTKTHSISSQYIWDTQGQKLIQIYSEMLSQPAKFSQTREEVLPPQSLLEKYGNNMRRVNVGEDPEPEIERETQKSYPSQNSNQSSLPIPFALEPFSTIILLSEIKRRMGIRVDRTFARAPVIARIIKGTYRLSIKPLAKLFRKIIQKSSPVAISAG